MRTAQTAFRNATSTMEPNERAFIVDVLRHAAARRGLPFDVELLNDCIEHGTRRDEPLRGSEESIEWSHDKNMSSRMRPTADQR